MARIMSYNGAICLFLLPFLINDYCCRGSEVPATQRFIRGDLLEYMGEDPNFWPVRGRRDDQKNSEVVYFGAFDGPFPYQRGGRKSKEEETGVFWAGRGRSFDANEALDSEEENFWAHRGRSAGAENDEYRNRLSAEEPRWIWMVRREPDKMHAKLADGNFPLCSEAKSYENEKREIAHQKLCNLKRKSNSLLRDIPRSEQFWPVRGKKSQNLSLRSKRPTDSLPTVLEVEPFWPLRGKRGKESWEEDLEKLKSFWPARGKRDGTVKELSAKAELSGNGKEVT